MSDDSSAAEVTLREVARSWAPLAASWLLMSFEVPMISAVVARLVDPEVHLAAYGGVVFPIALVVEAPIIMMLTASTALSRDRASYQSLRLFNHKLSAVLTAIHALLAFTPLFDRLLVPLLDVPAPVIEPARIGLGIMLPWTWAIASRRFNQGALIRFGRARDVGYGTAVRLCTGVLVLACGFALGGPGIVVATVTVAAGVLAEAAFAGLRARAVVRRMEPGDPSRALRGLPFLRFYMPLALTPLVTMIAQPIGAAAITRMPHALESLAAWPALSGVVFLLQSPAFALSEVVVATLGRPGAPQVLRRFAWILTLSITAVAVLLVATPLARLWFGDVTGLRPALTAMAVSALIVSTPMPGARGLQSWYQGVLVHAHRTTALGESVVVFLVVSVIGLAIGVGLGTVTGLVVASAVFAAARLSETAWLWLRSRRLRAALLRG
ncbi:MAG: hypothetical protein R3B09_22610 [Nannocystaceae bacterium]